MTWFAHTHTKVEEPQFEPIFSYSESILRNTDLPKTFMVLSFLKIILSHPFFYYSNKLWPCILLLLLVTKSCPTLYDPRAAAHKASLSMGFSRQEYWNELPFPSPGDVPKPGVKCVSCFSSSVQSLSHVRLFATPWTETHQASLAITNSQSISRWILYHWATKEAFCHKLILELQRASSFKNRIWDFLAGPVVNTSPSNAEGVGGSLVGELRSHMPCGQETRT